MKLQKAISERHQRLSVQQARLARHWRRPTLANKIAGAALATAFGIGTAVIVRKFGFTKLRRYYAVALMVTRLRAQMHQPKKELKNSAA